MTHDQHNETPNLLHVSDVFLCHFTCKPLNLRFSSLPTFLNKFVNILSSFPFFLVIPCYLFPATHLSSIRSSCYSVRQQSFRSSSNYPTIQQYQFLYHSLIHHARIQNIDFFHVKHANHPISVAKPILILPFKPLSFPAAPQQFTLVLPCHRKIFRTLGKLTINNHSLHYMAVCMCVCCFF